MKLFAMLDSKFQSIITLGLTLVTSYSFAQEIDIANAEKVFKKCAVCHVLKNDGTFKKLGPPLQDLAGRKAGTVEKYKYSSALKRAGEEGLIWNKETLSIFLKAPRKMIGKTKMSFSGLKKEQERDNLIAWLLDSSAVSNKGERPLLLGASALKLEPDIEYGQYLSGECVTCHQVNNTSGGIPSITGLPKDVFVHSVYEYKNEIRKNPVMRTIAKRLGDEELIALAAYFGSLPLK